MKISTVGDIEARSVSEPGSSGVTLRVLMGSAVGAPNFVMRHFELAPGGNTPFHTHDWEHQVFVLSGQGVVKRADGTAPIGPNAFVYVAPNEEHAFANTGETALAFLCVVPAGKYPGQ